ncbi:MAG: kelch motif-containing protein [Bacteroidales bacterium]|nr:kelch motif-containing protein [Bacteroidales bacterium]
MKKHYILTCLMAIAMISSCIKEEGEPYIVQRTDVNLKTLESSIKGYMHGEVNFDTIINNSFKTVITQKDNTGDYEEKLDVFFEVSSKYTYDFTYNQDTIVSSGYVYSQTNSTPVLNSEACYKFGEAEVKNIEKEINFSGEVHNLNHNTNYYVRSYVITAKNDTCYSPIVIENKTVQPSDVWFRRNDAQLAARTEAISTTTEGGRVYIYGGKGNMKCYDDMWVYNTKEDTWEQKATFTDNGRSSNLVAPIERCNGAAFLVTSSLKEDTLMYILGGESYNGEPTKHNFIYSLKHNRFNNSADHPYNRSHVEDFQRPMTGLVAFTIEGDMEEPVHFVGMGRITIVEGQSATAIQPDIYRYYEEYDKVDTVKAHEFWHEFTWKSVGSLSTDGHEAKDKTAEGFDQSVCVPISKKEVIIGSGISSREGNLYTNRFYKVGVNSANDIVYEKLPQVPEEFEPRANAAAFYLNYEKNGTQFDRFYVGTGVNSSGKPLKDFWAYDFGKKSWLKIADCGNVYREGAIGFKILRIDDYFVKNFSEPQERGIISFGNGTTNEYETVSDCRVRNDVWEYLP